MIRVARWMAGCLVGLVALPTYAQDAGSADDPFSGGTHFQPTWQKPTESGGGRLDCLYAYVEGGGGGCTPLNVEQCENVDVKRDIEILLQYDPATVREGIEAGSRLWVWYDDSSDCLGGKPAEANLEHDEVLAEASALAKNGTGTYSYPQDAQGRELNTKSVLEEFAACETVGGVDTERFLCFAVDMADINGNPDETIDNHEPRGWIRLLIDTRAPPNPDEIDVKSLDGALEITGKVAADSDDVAWWGVRWRPEPEEESKKNEECAAWDTTAKETETAADGQDSQAVKVTVENGVTYQACVYVRDKLGNRSEFSSIETGTAVDECDFMECYPGDLQTGYCGAAMGQAWLGAWALLCIALARRRRTLTGGGRR